MADRWYFTLQWRPKGPITHQQLQQLAADGDLTPTDLIWPEGGDPRRALEAQAVLKPSSFRPKAASGDWLGKMAQVLATTPKPAAAAPEWLADVAESEVNPNSEEAISTFLLAEDEQPAQPNDPQITVELVPLSSLPGAARSVPTAQPVSRPVPYPPRLVLGGASSRGMVRERNEDRYQTRLWNWNDAERTHEVAVLVVADGMGGYEAGDEASSLTVRTVMNYLARIVEAARPTDDAAFASAIEQSLRAANRVVQQKASDEARCKEMGATAAVVVIWNGHAYFSHVGDCRVYLHRDKALKQLTEDQTLVARMVAMGKITAEEAAQHESRNEVTQAIGKRSTIEPSKGDHDLVRGDSLLVACDGLAAHVDTPTFQTLLNVSPLPAQHLASHLVSLADKGGGSDNCTVVVARFD